MNTVNYARSLELDRCYLLIFTPLPGTPLAELAIQTGSLPRDHNFEDANNYYVTRLPLSEVPPEELQKVKNNFAAAEYRKLSSNYPILMHLIRNDGEGDWREINEAGPKIQAVTAADVKRVASNYFTKENRAVAIYTRKPGTATQKEATQEKQ